jgi:hypothetical protein
MAWRVDAVDAFTAWEVRHRPTPDEKGDMARWLDQCVDEGPPPADEVDEAGNLVVDGPANTHVRFRRWDFPDRDPSGYMFVLGID